MHEYFQGRPDVVTRRMFGGLCDMVSDHMRCCIARAS